MWPDIRKAVTDGDAAVLAGPENTYVLDGLDQALLEGPDAVDRKQLELAVELLVDAALQRGDSETTDALGTPSPLGNLVGAVIRPDPDRMAPAPPFDDEVAAWTVLVDRFASTLDWDGERLDLIDPARPVDPVRTPCRVPGRGVRGLPPGFGVGGGQIRPEGDLGDVRDARPVQPVPHIRRLEVGAEGRRAALAVDGAGVESRLPSGRSAGRCTRSGSNEKTIPG